MLTLLLLIQTLFSYIVPTYNPKTQVHLHLEKFNNELNLYHIGISFTNEDTIIRYDYRPFCEPNKCEFKTVNSVNSANSVVSVSVASSVSPVLNKELRFIDKLYRFYIPEKLPNKTIYWGETSKTLTEVVEFEKTMQKKYILGINDCRHYVNRFSRWALNKRTPIWKLDKLWNVTSTTSF
jgi:hypothetical protein